MKSRLKQKIASILVAGLALIPAGCNRYLTEGSEPKYTEARVADKEYKEEQDNLPIGIALGLSWDLINDDFPRGTTIGTAGGLITSEDAKHYITFKSENLEFKINDKRLFESFQSNDSANISYREIYDSVYDDSSGKPVQISRKLSHYEFLNAVKSTNQSKRAEVKKN